MELFTDGVKKELMCDAVIKAGEKYYLKTEMKPQEFLRKDNVETCNAVERIVGGG